MHRRLGERGGCTTYPRRWNVRRAGCGGQVGSNVLVGAGSLLLDDTEDDVVMYGSPARVIRRRTPGERWLKEV